jgi:ferrochelatase
MSNPSPPDTIAPPARPAASTPSMPAATVAVPPPTPASERVKASAIKVGVLLVNLGTPDSADAAGVRRYLKEFLADRRVIEDQGLVWKIVLKGILRFRPRRKALDYQKIWNTELDESPLKTFTRSQAQKLANTLNLFGNHIIVDWAMRYGNPSIASRVTELCNQGCDRLLVIPLYPQYSAATSASVCDEVFRVLTDLRRQPTLRIAAPYYDDSIYIDALANTLRAELARLSFEPDVIVASFHGMPQAYVDAAVAAEARDGRAEADAYIPVALRPCQMARASDHRQRQGAGQARCQEAGGDHARLRGRLPRDAGGDCGR